MCRPRRMRPNGQFELRARAFEIKSVADNAIGLIYRIGELVLVQF